MSPTEKQSFGMNGCVMLTSTETSPAGAYCAIQFITEGAITNLETSSLTFGTGALEDFTFPAGFVLYIPFTSVTLDAAANVVIYKSSL